MKESYGGVFWKVALSGLLDSAYKESKDQADASKTPEQESVTKGLWTTVQKRTITGTKVHRTATYKAKRIFLQKFARVTTESSESSTSLSQSPKLPGGANSNSLETALSPRSKRKVQYITSKRQHTLIIVPSNHPQAFTFGTKTLST